MCSNSRSLIIGITGATITPTGTPASCNRCIARRRACGALARGSSFAARWLPKIIKTFVDDVGFARENIFIATTGEGARDFLRERVFDMLVLDVMLRRRPESSPSCETSIELLTEITETNYLKRPGQIVGLTAYQEAEEQALGEFRQHSWTIVRSSDMNSEWLSVLAKSLQYLIDQNRQLPQAEHDVDLVVVTALASEMTAFQRGWSWESQEPLDDAAFIRRGRFQSKGRNFAVIAATSPRMGMVPAATLVTKLIQRFRPRVVTMPGICAGVDGKVEIGDVIMADTAWDYQSGKHITTSDNLPDFLIDPHFIGADAMLGAKWDQLAEDQALALEIARGWQAEKRRSPTLHRAPVGSGSAVLADANLVKGILRQQRKTLGVEMEIYGVYYAVEVASRPRPLVCAFKGVCDFADSHKEDTAQPFAAYASASYTRAFFEKYMADLC